MVITKTPERHGPTDGRGRERDNDAETNRDNKRDRRRWKEKEAKKENVKTAEQKKAHKAPKR